MKATENFRNIVHTHLKKMGDEDLLFLEKLRKDKKSFDDCIKYILNTVKNSGCAGFTDAEIFSMAVHYYSEDNIDMNGMENLEDIGVVVNHKVELSEEEIKEAKEKAKEKVLEDEYNRMKGLNSKKESPKIIPEQQSLF